jgi:hypothetical protein
MFALPGRNSLLGIEPECHHLVDKFHILNHMYLICSFNILFNNITFSSTPKYLLRRKIDRAYYQVLVARHEFLGRLLDVRPHQMCLHLAVVVGLA